MDYTLRNKFAKNLCKRTVLVQLIMKMWSRVFETQCIIRHQIYTVSQENRTATINMM